ncbi:MAG TPA: hypothetical protein VGL83_15865 [Stellaceae bacterium]
MTRTKVAICAAAVLTLAALAWFLPELQTPATAAVASAMAGRAAGVVLLGIALIATGLTFRWAMAAPPAPPPAYRPDSEFRRGFAKRNEPRFARSPARPPIPRGVVALRQAVIAQASMPRPKPTGATLPPTDIKRLQDLLESRVAQLGRRSVEPPSRRAPRAIVEGRDLPRP